MMDPEPKAPQWREFAYAAILTVACRQPTVHVDDILAEFTMEPHHPNAWGAVWQRAIREGVIQRSGSTRQCLVHLHKHSHQYPIYNSLIYGGYYE